MKRIKLRLEWETRSLKNSGFLGVKAGMCFEFTTLLPLHCRLENEFSYRNVGDTMIVKLKVWSLSYADDLVYSILIAENREALLDMADTMKRFLKNKKLILSEEKQKS